MTLVIAWGRDSDGQLGIEDEQGESVRMRSSPPRVGLLCRSEDHEATSTYSAAGQRVVLASCGSNFTLLLTERGDVWSCGNNRHGQLGYATLDMCSPKPAPALVNRRVVKLACGADHAAIVTTSGRLYTWGDNKSGQLGLGHKRCTGSSGPPGPIEVKAPIKRVADYPTAASRGRGGADAQAETPNRMRMRPQFGGGSPAGDEGGATAAPTASDMRGSQSLPALRPVT